MHKHIYINKCLTLTLLSTIVAVSGCVPERKESLPTVIPFNLTAGITIDGSIDEKEWDKSLKINRFLSPWNKDKIPETVFYTSSDSLFFYFAFKVTDENIIAGQSPDEESVALGDRVEIFFARDKDLKEYYCLEIDPYGNVLDYKASFYRSFDNNWGLSGLFVRTSVSEKGYEVEARIPLDFLRDIGMLNLRRDQICLYMGVYRANFVEEGQAHDSVMWLTWIDPNQNEPDFHVPDSFSKVCIENPH